MASLSNVGFWTQATLVPERTAVIDVDGTSISYGDLLSEVNQLSRAMCANGVAHGGHVVVVSWNRYETLLVALAILQIGATFTLVNAHSTASEIAYVLDDSAPAVLFMEASTAECTRAAWQSSEARPMVINFDESGGGMFMSEWLDGYDPHPPARRAAGAAMLYTSGTSGRPKGVVRQQTAATPEAAAAAATGLLTRLGIEPADLDVGHGVHLVSSPIYHSAPIHNALLALHLGHKVVLMDRFDARRSLELVEEYRVTWTHVVPTMMQRWLGLDASVRKTIDLSSLRWVIHAAAPCPVDVKREVIDWLGPVVYEYYSSTEVGGTAIGPQDWLRHPGSVGKAWAGTDVRILDENREVLPPGEVGDIYIRNDASSFHYHNDPDKTAGARVGEYVTIGDMGWLDDEGFLFIADRRKDLILVGGVNVYPAEIEAALLRHPLVADVAVIGRPDRDLGQSVHAIVQPLDKETLESAELLESLREHAARELGSQKRPRSYELRAKLPRTDTGKLLRRLLRDEPGSPSLVEPRGPR